MSKIDKALATASQMREFLSDDNRNQVAVYKKDRREKKWLYISIVTIIAFILVIMSFILFINIKEQAANRALIEELQITIAKLETTLLKTNQEIQANVETKSGGLFLYSRPDDIEKLKIDSRYASQIIYTIQTGSMISVTNAQKQFNSILQSLDKKELNFLRIEKIGKYHTVRLGKFENHATTEKFLQEIKPRLSEAIILKAYMRNENIIKLYGDD
jgi:hypothetical protein